MNKLGHFSKRIWYNGAIVGIDMTKHDHRQRDTAFSAVFVSTSMAEVDTKTTFLSSTVLLKFKFCHCGINNSLLFLNLFQRSN